MDKDFESMYQYDARSRQYRRRSEATASAGTRKAKASSGGDIYAIGSKHEKLDLSVDRLKRPPKVGVLRQVVWIVSLLVLAGWLYFMATQKPGPGIDPGGDAPPPPDVLRLAP